MRNLKKKQKRLLYLGYGLRIFNVLFVIGFLIYLWFWLRQFS